MHNGTGQWNGFMTMQMQLGMELLDVRFVGIPQDLTPFIVKCRYA
ncbi:hypothetical protein [Bowmanella pacifica]|nr:hypothetical protein [Bowmanella pacifica]